VRCHAADGAWPTHSQEALGRFAIQHTAKWL
jgi:hypothetical protein